MADLSTQIRLLADRRFAETEPVSFHPDAPSGLGVTNTRVDNAPPVRGTEMIMRSNETVQPRRRWYALGAAAGLVAVAVVGIAIFAGDDDLAEPAASPTLPADEPTLPGAAPTPIELIGADGKAEAIEAFAVVEAAFEAFNRGDAMGWATARSAPGAPPSDPDDVELQYPAAAHAAGARYDVIACEYGGSRDVGAVGGDSVVDHHFTCETKFMDAFTEAAGLDFDEEFDWTVADGRVVDATSTFGDRTILRTFMDGLRTWMAIEHPDTPYTEFRFYGYPTAAEVPAVLQLVDEFVAAHDEWPLPDG